MGNSVGNKLKTVVFVVFLVLLFILFVCLGCLLVFLFFFQNCKYKSTQRSQYQPLPEPYHVTFSVTGVTSPLAPL